MSGGFRKALRVEVIFLNKINNHGKANR
jgi:hypothetical protein